MKAEASISTNGNASEGSDSDPESGDLHAKDEHKEDFSDNPYQYGYADILADYLSRFRLYAFLLLVLLVVGAWYFGLPRYSYFFGATLVFSMFATWRYIFDYVSRLDDGISNLVIELFPDDGADHHGYEVGDGVLPDFDNEGTPAYPVRGVPDVYEVEDFDPHQLEYRGPPRASLPYADYVDIELRGRYHREEVIPMLDELPRLRARNAAETTAQTTAKTVSNIELIEKALSGDLEPTGTPHPVLDDDEDLETHGSELSHERNGSFETKEASDD